MNCIHCGAPLGMAWWLERYLPRPTSANVPRLLEPPNERLGPYCLECIEALQLAQRATAETAAREAL